MRWHLSTWLVLAALLTAAPSQLEAQSGYSVPGANAYVARKDWNGLLNYCRGWAQAEPTNPLAWYYMGSTYGVGLRQPEAAVAAFHRAAALKSSWPELWNALGSEYMKMKRYKEASDSFRVATQQNPQKMNYWCNLAAAYTRHNRWPSALRAVQDGARNAGPSARWQDWYLVGKAYASLAEPQQAVSAYNRCLRMNPRFGKGWNSLGIAQEALGNWQEATPCYRQGAGLGDASARANLSTVQERRRQAQLAAQARQQQAGGGQTQDQRDRIANQAMGRQIEADQRQRVEDHQAGQYRAQNPGVSDAEARRRVRGDPP
jgi:tetratricopeptide (TPR) repeat protein